MAEFSKTTFTVVDLTKIIAIVLCFFVQNYSLKNEMHDLMTTQTVEKQVVAMQFAFVDKRLNALEGSRYHTDIVSSPADKPKPIKIESE